MVAISRAGSRRLLVDSTLRTRNRSRRDALQQARCRWSRCAAPAAAGLGSSSPPLCTNFDMRPRAACCLLALQRIQDDLFDGAVLQLGPFLTKFGTPRLDPG